MNPLLREGQWSFCTLPAGAAIPPGTLALFHEDQETTVILPSARARAAGLVSRYAAAWITLTVASDLEAVGFLAAVSRALAGASISCNVVSAVHHDHLFVPYSQRHRAMEVLRLLQASPRGDRERS